MQDDSADGADDVDAELEESVAEPRHLGASARGAGGAPAKLLQEHVGGGGQQDADWFAANRQQLVRSNLQSVEQLLDSVLDVPARAVDFS